MEEERKNLPQLEEGHHLPTVVRSGPPTHPSDERMDEWIHERSHEKKVTEEGKSIPSFSDLVPTSSVSSVELVSTADLSAF